MKNSKFNIPATFVVHLFSGRGIILKDLGFMDRRFKNFVSQKMMDSALENTASDELKLRAVEKNKTNHPISSNSHPSTTAN